MVKRQFGTIASVFKRVSLSTWLSLVLGTAVLVVLIEWLDSWSLRVMQDWTHLQQHPTDATQKQFNASLEIVKAIVGGIGTLATIAGGIVLYMQFRVANQNAKTAIKTWKVANRNAAIANKNAEIANKTVELTESRLITERFSKAVEQLGSDKIEVRLGGIYSLERIAQDSVRDHWTIMEVLTAFVRERSPVKPRVKNSFTEHYLQQSETEKPTPVTKDVQAALTVIGRRNVENDDPDGKNPDGKRLDLSFSNLDGADLYRAKLSNAFLNAVDLHDADLRFSTLNQASLLDADLSEAFLNGAKLIGADLSGAKLNGAKLDNADLSGAILDETAFFDVDLTAVHLLDAPLNTALFCRTTMPNGTVSDRDCEAMNIPLSTSSANETEPGSH